MEGLGLPPRIEKLLQAMVTEPSARSHLLMIGPPGSGKTTSARIFVEALHNISKSYFGRALFLNSSDERGLEAVRSRVYPFIRSSFDSLFVTTGPKVIVFDEAETLTDQAQIALRPLLDMSPQKVLIIFLCNSISRINPCIVHNGMIYGITNQMFLNSQFSDTFAFVKYIMAADGVMEMYNNSFSTFELLTDSFLGNDKLCLLHPDRDLTTVGKYLTDNGYLHSNSGYKVNYYDRGGFAHARGNFMDAGKVKKSKKSLLDVKYAEPKQVSDTETKLKENAVIGLKAMREAIDSKESKKELDKLSSMILQDYGVKIMINKKTGLLRAMAKDGKVISQETTD